MLWIQLYCILDPDPEIRPNLDQDPDPNLFTQIHYPFLKIKIFVFFNNYKHIMAHEASSYLRW